MDDCGFLSFVHGTGRDTRDGGDWSLLYLGYLTPRESPMSPLNSRLSGPQSWCGCFGGKKNLFLLSGFKPWFIHFIAYSLC